MRISLADKWENKDSQTIYLQNVKEQINGVLSSASCGVHFLVMGLEMGMYVLLPMKDSGGFTALHGSL